MEKLIDIIPVPSGFNNAEIHRHDEEVKKLLNLAQTYLGDMEYTEFFDNIAGHKTVFQSGRLDFIEEVIDGKKQYAIYCKQFKK